MSTATLEDRIAAIEDRLALTDLLSRFCQFTDEQRWDDLAALFTTEAVLEIREPISGRDSIREFVSHLPEVWDFWWHYVANETFEIDGDRAVGVSYFDAPFVMDGTSMNALGRYDDAFVREADGEWRFARRVLSFASSMPVGDGWDGVPDGVRAVHQRA